MDMPPAPSGDLIADLGYLCLGSRLKRLGERMQSGVAQHLAVRGLDVQPAQLPLLWALGVDGPLTVGALGERLGISQPGVSRALVALQRQGLVTRAEGGQDKRRRVIAISAAGAKLMAELSASFFPAVRGAVADVCAATGVDLLAAISRIEADLDRQPLEDRIARTRKERP